MTGSAYGTSIVSQYTAPAYRTQVGKGVVAPLELETKEVEEVRGTSCHHPAAKHSLIVHLLAPSLTPPSGTRRRRHKFAWKFSIDCPTGRLLPAAECGTLYPQSAVPLPAYLQHAMIFCRLLFVACDVPPAY